MDDEWTINGKNSTKGTRINAENQRVTITDVGRENPSLSAELIGKARGGFPCFLLVFRGL